MSGLLAMGFTGNERSTRRAVAEAKQAWSSGHRRSYRPCVPEPGLWLQLDWGEGPRIGGRRTQLFCAWLSWSRYRVVLPAWDQTLPTLVSCLDTVLRRIGGAPTYVLTDNPKTVTVEHVAGVAIRHPEAVAAGRHYGCKVETCGPFDPESKGGVEATVKIAKADWCRGRRTWRRSTSRSCSWRMPASSSARGSTTAYIARRGRHRLRGWPSSASICMSCRGSRMPSRWARSGWSTRIRPCRSGRCGTRPRLGMSGRRCGAGSPVTNSS